MLELAIALVVISCIAGYLVNKVIERKYPITNSADIAALNQSLDEQIHTVDNRLKDTWAAISSTKEELNRLKVRLGLTGKLNDKQ